MTVKYSSKTILEDAESVASAPIKVTGGETLFEGSVSLGKNVEGYYGVRSKEKLVFDESSGSEPANIPAPENIYKIPISNEHDSQTKAKYIDPTLTRIYNKSFLVGAANNVKSSLFPKILCSIAVFCFGGYGIVVKAYLIIAAIKVLLGLWPETQKSKPMLERILQRVSMQMLYFLFIVAAVWIAKVLPEMSFSIGESEYGIREGVIVFVCITNFCEIGADLKRLGAEIPEEIVKAIKSLSK